MSDDIILNEEERLKFWSFIEAPQAKPEMKITAIYLTPGISMLRDYPEKVGEFLADAHSRGLKVDYLTGSPYWALTIDDPNGIPYNQPSFNELSDLLNYNASVHETKRFDGYQQDTEPYILGGDGRNDPLSWQDDTEEIWAQYIETMTIWKSMIDTHNTNTGDDLLIGASIPPWWDPAPGTSVNHETVQDLIDYIAIMNYNTRAPISSGIESELDYAQAQGYTASVYSGMECLELNYKERIVNSVFKTLYTPTSSYFYGNDAGMYGIEALYQDTTFLLDTFEDNNAFIGSAYHYYENSENGDSALRTLGKIPYKHAPSAWVVSPSYSEVLSGNEEIRYVVYDPDADTLNVLIEYSSDEGLNWTTVTNLEISDQTDVVAYRTESWDVSNLPTGNNYRLRITVTEVTPQGLSSFDQSDFEFTVAENKTDTIPPASVHALSIQSSYDASGEINLWWDEAIDNEGIAGYLYAYAPIIDPANAYFSRGNRVRLDAPTVDSVLYLRAIDFSGNVSPQSAYALAAIDSGFSLQSAYALTAIGDTDGDGVSDPDEIDEGTDPNDPLDYSPSRVLGHWKFEGNLSNAIAGGPELIEETVVGGSMNYGNGMFFNGQAAQIDGTMPVRLLLDDTTDPLGSGTQALTVEMWIKPDPASQNNLSFIPLASFGDMDGGLTLLLKNDGDLLSVRRYATSGDGSYRSINADNDNLFDGNWHHVACTFDGYNGFIRLYINGQLVNQKQLSSLASFMSNTRVLRFFDGRSNYDTDNNLPESDPVNINTGQFENNRFNFIDEAGIRYLGWVDNIKVTRATVPIEQLGYYQDQFIDYNGWKNAAFGVQANNPEVSDPEIDYSGDGIANLLAYASGLDPVVNNSIDFIHETITEVKGGQRYLSRYFLQSKTAAIDFKLQSSSDCSNWFDEPNAVVYLEDQTDNSWIKKVSVPLNETKLFFRMTVEN